MRLQPGETLHLNGVVYQITGPLGTGAITENYRATIRTALPPVVVRILAEGFTANSLEAGAMRHEADLITRLNAIEEPNWPTDGDPSNRIERAQATVRQRGIIAQFDAGFDQNGRPVAIHELAPSAYNATPITNIGDERRCFEIFAALLAVVERCHQHRIALHDFDPARGKINRVRVAWNDAEDRLAHLKIIDWNVSGDADTRAQDLVFLGAYLNWMLFQRTAGPVDVSTTSLSRGALIIAERCAQLDTSPLYTSVARLRHDVVWWLQCLQAENAQDLAEIGKADTSGWAQDAVAILGAQRFPEARSRFARPRAEQSQRVDQTALLALDHGRTLLQSQRFAEAAQEFTKRSKAPNAQPEVIRRARIYALVAETATLIPDEHANTIDELIELGHLLVQRSNDEAALRSAVLQQRLEGTAAGETVRQLTRPFQLAQTIADLTKLQLAWQSSLPQNLSALLNSEPASISAELSSLSTMLQTLIADPNVESLEREHAVQAIEQAQQLEAASDRLIAARSLVREAQTLDIDPSDPLMPAAIAQLQQASTQFGLAADHIRSVQAELWVDLQNHQQIIDQRCAILIQQQKRALAVQQALAAAPEQIYQGAYQAIVDAARAAQELDSDSNLPTRWETLARLGLQRAEKSQYLLEHGKTSLSAGELSNARSALQQLHELDGQPIVSSATGEDLADLIDPTTPPVFRLPNTADVSRLERLCTELENLERQLAQLSDNRTAQRNIGLSAIERFEEAGLPPADRYIKLAQQPDTIAIIDELLDALQAGREPLSSILAQLADLVPAAPERREQIMAMTMEQIVGIPDVKLALTAAQDAVPHFTDPQLHELAAHLQAGAMVAQLMGELLDQQATSTRTPVLITRIDRDLAALSGVATSVRSLHNLAEHWQFSRPAVVEATIEAAMRAAGEHASTGSFSAAFLALQGIAPAEIFAQTAPSALIDRVQRLRSALSDAVQAEQQLEVLINQLEQTNVPNNLAENASAIRLPAHPDVPTDDLVELRDLFIQVAHDSFEPDQLLSGVERLQAYYAAAEATTNLALQASRFVRGGEHLGAIFAARAERQRTAAEQIGLQACDVLESATQSQQRPIKELIDAYRTVQTWREYLPSERHDRLSRIAQSLTHLRNIHEATCDEARAATEQLRDYTNLTALMERLASLVQLHQTIDPHEAAHEFPQTALEQWNDWALLLHEQTQSDRSVRDFDRLRVVTEELQMQVWPVLFTYPLTESHFPGALFNLLEDSYLSLALPSKAAELPDLLRFLQKVQSFQERLSPIANGAHGELLAVLGQKLEFHWVTASQQTWGAVDYRLTQTLGLPFDQAVTQLRDGVLQPGASLGADLTDAIERATNIRLTAVSQRGPALTSAVAVVCWAIIAEASKPWVDGDMPIARLNATARQRLEELNKPIPTPTQSNNPLVLTMAGLSVVLFLAVIIISLFASRTEEAADTGRPILTATTTAQPMVIDLNERLDPVAASPGVTGLRIPAGTALYPTPNARIADRTLTQPAFLLLCSRTPQEQRLPLALTDCSQDVVWVELTAINPNN